MILLTVLSIFVAIGGVLSLSEATTGVGLLALAIYCAVWVRINQASAHQSQLLAAHKRPEPPASA